MITDKDIRDIQAFNKGLLPPHREERFKERLLTEPELKAKFDEYSPMMKALEEVNFEHKIREIITKKEVEPAEIEEVIITQKAIPLYKRMWVYVAAACVLMFVVVGIDYRKNQKLREELLVIQRREDSLRAIYSQKKKPKINQDSIDYQEKVIVDNDSLIKKQNLQNQLITPQNDKIITEKKIPKTPDKEFVKVPDKKEISPKNNLEDDENDIPEINSLKGAKNFTKTISIIFKTQKIKKLSDTKEGILSVRFSKKDFSNPTQVGNVHFFELTNIFSLSIAEQEICSLLQKKSSEITQKTNDVFTIDLGNEVLELNVKTGIVIRIIE
jgi:hypothetical protein